MLNHNKARNEAMNMFKKIVLLTLLCFTFAGIRTDTISNLTTGVSRVTVNASLTVTGGATIATNIRVNGSGAGTTKGLNVRSGGAGNILVYGEDSTGATTMFTIAENLPGGGRINVMDTNGTIKVQLDGDQTNKVRVTGNVLINGNISQTGTELSLSNGVVTANAGGMKVTGIMDYYQATVNQTGLVSTNHYVRLNINGHNYKLHLYE